MFGREISKTRAAKRKREGRPTSNGKRNPSCRFLRRAKWRTRKMLAGQETTGKTDAWPDMAGSRPKVRDRAG